MAQVKERGEGGEERKETLADKRRDFEDRPPGLSCLSGLQIISQLAPVKLSGQTYFCSDISHFWPDKHRLRLIAIKVPPHPFT